MNILLVGEYSRLHNSLKEGLEQLGHHVVILGFQDGFKKYPVDFPLHQKWDASLLKKIRVGIYKLTGFDVSSYFTYRQFQRYEKQLTGFDVVQFINENSFYCTYKYEKKSPAISFSTTTRKVISDVVAALIILRSIITLSTANSNRCCCHIGPVKSRPMNLKVS